MFAPTQTEIDEMPDLIELIEEGRRVLKSPEGRAARIREQIEEVRALAERRAQAQMAHFQWRPRASVALINQCTCINCGSQIALFAGFGVSMFRNSDTSERIVMTAALDRAWPRETHTTVTHTAACGACVESFGFKLPLP